MPDKAGASLLQALSHPLSDRRLEVLRHIALGGSISQAAREVGISYKAAWQAIDTLSNLAGTALVHKSVGGAGGGGARLTPAGQALLRAADAMVHAKDAVLQRMRAPTQLPGLGLQTSMRNQWPCVVNVVEHAGPLALVHMHSEQGHCALQARLTSDSAQMLGLQPGMRVLALCKATAVQVLPSDSPDAINTWPGKATRITAGQAGDEVAAQIEGGVQLVGFTAQRTGWRVGRKVRVHVPAAAVVLALAA